MKRKWITLLTITSIIAILVMGCSASKTKNVKSDGVFNVAISTDLPTMDPVQCNDYSAELVINNLYDTLLKFSVEDNHLEPGLAKSWEKVDELTYVYQLRDDVYFWDGQKMTADDVVFSLRRHMDPSLASLFGPKFNAVESIEKTGDFEVTIRLSYQSESFKYIPATMAGSVVEKAFVEEAGENFGKTNTGTMGTGPYKFDSWTEGSTIIFKKNENYWDSSVSYPEDVLEFDIIADVTSVGLALTSGQVDFFNTPTEEVREQVASSDKVENKYAKGLQNSFIYFNSGAGPFNDINLRKAAATALDTNAIALATRGEGFFDKSKALDVDPQVMGYYPEDWIALNDELDSYEYNLEKAKEYMAQSAYPDGVEVTMPTCTLVQKESEAAQYYLKQIGINVKLETVPFSDFILYVYGVLLDDQGQRDYDLLAFAWFPDFADPVALLYLYQGINIGIGGYNMANYLNPEVDSLIELSDIQSGQERSETLMKAYRIINEACTGKMISYFGPSCSINTNYSVELPAMWMWNFNFTQVHKKNETNNN
ncbi:MAG: ABC transporter substrate-binding protein [Spirochaetales bacterium]|nr:ABC transporter substrate-binding protein [Spirochaetales bacterium]